MHCCSIGVCIKVLNPWRAKKPLCTRQQSIEREELQHPSQKLPEMAGVKLGSELVYINYHVKGYMLSG